MNASWLSDWLRGLENVPGRHQAAFLRSREITFFPNKRTPLENVSEFGPKGLNGLNLARS